MTVIEFAERPDQPRVNLGLGESAGTGLEQGLPQLESTNPDRQSKENRAFPSPGTAAKLIFSVLSTMPNSGSEVQKAPPLLKSPIAVPSRLQIFQSIQFERHTAPL